MSSDNHFYSIYLLFFDFNFFQSLFCLIKKVTKKIKKIRFPAHRHPPSADFQACARSPKNDYSIMESFCEVPVMYNEWLRDV